MAAAIKIGSVLSDSRNNCVVPANVPWIEAGRWIRAIALLISSVA